RPPAARRLSGMGGGRAGRRANGRSRRPLMAVVIGFLVAAAIGLTVVLAARGRKTVPLESHPWVLHETAKSHVDILGSLAGFAFTGVVLVVTFVRDRNTAADTALDIVITMFLV